MRALLHRMPDWLRWMAILGIGFALPIVVLMNVDPLMDSGWSIVFVLGCWMVAGYVGRIDE